MNNLRSSWRTFLFLIASISICNALGSGAVASSQDLLIYFPQSSSHPSSILLKSPRGKTYRLSLIPELDIEKHAVVLDLVLQGPDRRGDDSNLFDTTGKLHGYQPFFFAASDFVRGPQNSSYGGLRVIDLHQLGMRMRVKVAEVNVEPTAPNSSHASGYQFNDLTLQITTQSLGPVAQH